MASGSRFLQYAQYMEVSLLQHFCKRVRQCYTTRHTSIGTSCRHIIVCKRQRIFLLVYYDTLMETCDSRKKTIWAQSLRTLCHRLMQVLTRFAAQQKWSNAEDCFWADAATVHLLKKRSQPCNSESSNLKKTCMPHTSPTPSKSDL